MAGKIVIVNASGTLMIGEMDVVNANIILIKNPLILMQQQNGQIGLTPLPFVKMGEDLFVSVNYTFYYEAKDDNIRKAYNEAAAQFFKNIQIASPKDIENITKVDDSTLLLEKK